MQSVCSHVRPHFYLSGCLIDGLFEPLRRRVFRRFGVRPTLSGSTRTKCFSASWNVSGCSETGLALGMTTHSQRISLAPCTQVLLSTRSWNHFAVPTTSDCKIKSAHFVQCQPIKRGQGINFVITTNSAELNRSLGLNLNILVGEQFMSTVSDLCSGAMFKNRVRTKLPCIWKLLGLVL